MDSVPRRRSLPETPYEPTTGFLHFPEFLSLRAFERSTWSGRVQAAAGN
jgi:hypothetical protein